MEGAHSLTLMEGAYSLTLMEGAHSLTYKPRTKKLHSSLVYYHAGVGIDKPSVFFAIKQVVSHSWNLRVADFLHDLKINRYYFLISAQMSGKGDQYLLTSPR